MPMIRARNVSKRYSVGKAATTLKEAVASWMSGQTSSESLWALRDVNLSVNAGEAVGILGNNGAGKSTLLRLLARLSRPTTGQLETKGRMAALLHLGAGFHPDLTGRENVFLNGTLLGLARSEIKK